MFGPRPRHSCLHQTRGAFGKNDFLVRGNVIAMRVRDKSKRLRVPRIEPQIAGRQINAAVVAHFDHCRNLAFAETHSKCLGPVGDAVSVPFGREASCPYRSLDLMCGLTPETRTGFIDCREMGSRIVDLSVGDDWV